MSTDSFLRETFDKWVDTKFGNLSKINVTQLYLDDPYMLAHIFNYKTYTSLTKEYKICRINYFAIKTHDFTEDFNISPKIMSQIEQTNEIQFYNFLGENTGWFYFILNRVFKDFSKSAKILRVHQIGMKAWDESLFTFLAMFLRYQPDLTSVCIYGRNYREYRHLRKLWEDQETNKDEIWANEIHNAQHIFNFYQQWMKKSNLLEWRILLFLTNYNFTMLAGVLKNNPNLQILEVRNVIVREMSQEKQEELDYTFKEMNSYGDNIKDEIFIFINYLFALESLKELRITHFTFMTEIPFMATQCAKTLPNLEFLSFENCQNLINNDGVLFDSYGLAATKITELHMGNTYYHLIRDWSAMWNVNIWLKVNVGVVDFVSFCALLRLLEHTNWEHVTVRLNQPCRKESNQSVINQIIGSPMRAKNLKFWYIWNALRFHDYSNQKKNKKTQKGILNNRPLEALFDALRENQTIRRLSFQKPRSYYYDLKDDVGFNTFKYIRKRDFDTCIYMIRVLDRKFEKVDQAWAKEIKHDIMVARFGTYRRWITA